MTVMTLRRCCEKLPAVNLSASIAATLLPSENNISCKQESKTPLTELPISSSYLPSLSSGKKIMSFIF